MRRYFLLAALAVIVTSSVVSAQEDKEKPKHSDSDKPKIEGSGNVVTKVHKCAVV